jgi:cell division protein FtsN
MLSSFLGKASASANSLESKLMLYIVAGIVILVVINLLLDSVRKYIRGLDTAALGVLFLWLGYESTKLNLISALANLLFLVGGTLLAMGIIIFVIIRLIKRSRKVRNSKPPMPKEMPKPKEPAQEEKPAEESSEGKNE